MSAVIGAGVAVLMIPVLLVAAAAAVLASLMGGSAGGGGYVLPTGATGIPEPMATYYKDASRDYRIAWPLLAAVGKVECDHNRLRDRHGMLLCVRPNSAGAVGPMQFLPSTFAAYAPLIGENASILDEHDSVYAAAAKLSSDGLAVDPWRALHAYNHSDRYVATVLAWAVRYGWFTDNRPLLGKAVLAHDHLSLREDARADVSAGRVDPRVLGVLLSLATTHQVGGIGPFTRHHCLVNRTSHLSNHVFGRAVDVFTIDRAPVSEGNAAARGVVSEVLALPQALLPDEIGQPWADLAAQDRVFTDVDHDDHLHLGFDTGQGKSAIIQTPGCR